MSTQMIQENAFIGREAKIHNSAKFLFKGKGKLKIGDYSRIEENVQIIVYDADVTIGDWTTLHPSCLVLGGVGVDIGEHCWFGQNTVLDGTGGLKIGRGVRVGMYSQIWTHVAAGEQLEGCTLFSERPVEIQDDVWLVGSCVVGSGVSIGRRTVALAGSNITKSCEPNVVLAGAPAKVKESISFYKDLTLNEKMQMLDGWLNTAKTNLHFEKKFDPSTHTISVSREKDTLLFVGNSQQALEHRKKGSATVACLEDKSYNKTFTRLEKDLLSYLEGNKARFYHI